MKEAALEWQKAGRQLIGKCLGEMAYEQIFQPCFVECLGKQEKYRLHLKTDIVYQFIAWRTVWDYLRVDPDSIERLDQLGFASPASDAAQFFIDCRFEMGMSEIILGQFLEEMHQTLYADMQVQRKWQSTSAAEVIHKSDSCLQSYLEGHPKALLNKGRLGWGTPELKSYAPESSEGFQLFWLAARKDRLQVAFADSWSEERILQQSFSPKAMEILCENLDRIQVSLDDYLVFPVHPWQWSHVIQIQYAADIANRQLIALGFHGDYYQPQTSIRSLANLERPQSHHVKLSVSILNTSCVRGIPAKYISIGPRLSAVLNRICSDDRLLREAGTEVLNEYAALSYKQPHYSSLKGFPYRLQELLGVIWRESPDAKLNYGEQSVLTAAFFQKDASGDSLISHYISASGLSIEDWLRAYFKTVVIPLFHLQCKYGIGIVAHGQNVGVKLKDFVPTGMFLKDFQGDLRLIQEDWPELDVFDAEIKTVLTRLPAEYLIQDLQTGHFVTVLRFISATLFETTGFEERQFYRILSELLNAYEDSHPELIPRFANMSLLKSKIPRVLINKVRFQIGYGDSDNRPLPQLGSDLDNPLQRP